MSALLRTHLLRQRHGVAAGIYSVCSAHPWVIRAAAEQAVQDGTLLLIEATSNQVNQFGGYTGMRPADFREFVLQEIRKAGLNEEKLILGGDHLGPNPWRKFPAAEAMAHAEVMVAEYVAAGFTKIHLDASMACADDHGHPSDEMVASRATQLCKVAEAAAVHGVMPIYVIGTEVPVPGGATHSIHDVPATSTSAVSLTLAVHKKTFLEQVPAAWERVIALVVQPGVEFDHDSVLDYDAAKAADLSRWLREQQESIVFEAHSTDYQTRSSLAGLVHDGFAILKVGPGVTFAMRESLEALEAMESQLIPAGQRSGLSDVIERTMLSHPENWEPYYPGTFQEQKLLRRYSYSDRVRYYWGDSDIAAAVRLLVANLSSVELPESMLSGYMPNQYWNLRAKKIAGDPESLIIDRIRDVLRDYSAACPVR